MSTEKNKVYEALGYLKKIFPDFRPDVLVVLGSGLGDLARDFKPFASLDYSDVPGFVDSTVEGHEGTLFLCRDQDLCLAVMSGRVHLYEGRSPGEVVRNLRVMGLWGSGTAVLTNAAGALNPLFSTGNIMLITDHINMTGENPLVGDNVQEWGPRFPDMSNIYCRELQSLAAGAALEAKIPLEKGVYMGIKGPSLETPAETKAFRKLGADSIGMSTTLEAIAARHLGMRVLGYSCLTNKNLPDCMAETSHEEILEQARKINNNLVTLLRETLPRLTGVVRGQ
ncbi:inosine guanosine and xanthosine phosphorylase family [Desulfonatronospira thiodismutans ASO3-1]|uniref:Purine nucleoside phosphorylase n=1 Tax=Desulfonatronospira thiodismutans ASO3-1 TaxID=555779 RepID=D6SQD0_9BACT|nr:purine-nucleoside phosphorylase [Desulfonatronospira thiodismutans]EFI34956.1 inosine guanosine and xanthosine phosphorylase family [Desulfonatronospira thiodismutans ASO3-1]